MIYLIRSAAFKDKSNPKCTEYEPILKIGYTKDSSKKGRFDCYITENPTCQVLYLIPEGDEQDEKNLHYYFRNYLKYGQEWFSYEEEILDFFDTHTTKDSLKELDISLSIRGLDKRAKEIELMYINPILRYEVKANPDTYISTEKKLYEMLNTNLCFLDKLDLDRYFKIEYSNVDFDTALEKEAIPANIENPVSDFYKLSNIMDQLKFAENQEKSLSKQDFNAFLNCLPVRIQNYIILLGFSKIKACGYQLSKIIKRLEKRSIDKTSKDNIKSEIIKSFLVGNKYSKQSIKDTLKFIYKFNGYNQTPRAIDLEEYFELKDAKIPNKVTGKRDNGYKIISLKENK